MHDDVSAFAAERLQTCPACGSGKVSLFRKGVDYHYGIAGEYSTDICADCGMVFMNPMPSVTELARFYPEDYYSYQPPSLDYGWRHRLAEALGVLKKTHMPRFAKPGRVLDLGCGAGHYLLKLKAAGWDVRGSELSRAAAEAGRKAGLDIRYGELMQAGFEDGEFDFVRSNHSFEHIPNPDEVLQEIRRILKPGGKLFIGVPNMNSFWSEKFGKYWWYFGLPVHTHNYNYKNLPILLERHNFQVENVYWNSDYASSVGSLQIRSNAKNGVVSSDGKLIRSKFAVLAGHVAAKISDLFRRGDCIEVIAVRD